MTYFFEDIKKLTILEEQVLGLGLAEYESKELLKLARSATHHKVMDFILSELKNENGFVYFFSEEFEHGFDLQTTKKKIEDFEAKVEKIINESESELLKLLG